jgi:hypothetical protein
MIAIILSCSASRTLPGCKHLSTNLSTDLSTNCKWRTCQVWFGRRRTPYRAQKAPRSATRGHVVVCPSDLFCNDSGLNRTFTIMRRIHVLPGKPFKLCAKKPIKWEPGVFMITHSHSFLGERIHTRGSRTGAQTRWRASGIQEISPLKAQWIRSILSTGDMSWGLYDRSSHARIPGKGSPTGETRSLTIEKR